MSKRDDAYNRVKRYVEFPSGGALQDLFDADLRILLDVFEDWETEHEILSDLVTDESERRAIGGGPNWQERHAKTWARAMELFEP